MERRHFKAGGDRLVDDLLLFEATQTDRRPSADTGAVGLNQVYTTAHAGRHNRHPDVMALTIASQPSSRTCPRSLY
jgi:hypothetical protein